MNTEIKNAVMATDQDAQYDERAKQGKIDLLNIVLIGLSSKLPEYSEKYELHRLLVALLSMDLSVDEKLNIIEKEYNIPIEDSIRKEVGILCNLSQGILERGEEKIIVSMYKNGYPLEEIAKVAERTTEEVKAIIEKREAVLV